VRLVPGIEVSCLLNRREIHVLGHFVDPSEPGLARFAGVVRGRRRERMVAMIDRLNGMNVRVTIEQVEAVADGAALARPHLARTLVELRVCSSVSDAFHRFLADGHEAVVVREDVTPQDAVALIHAAGGTASLAHPASSRVNPAELKELKAWGLDALEVYHPDHPPSQQQKLLEHCAELDLVPTGGSDFHGEVVTPGRRLGAMTLPLKHFERLEARRP